MLVTLDNENIVIGTTGVQRKVQQVKTVLGTIKGTVPFDRSFGVDFEFLDKPPEAAKLLIITNVIDELEKQVDGISVEDVTFDNEELQEGIIKPKVEVKIED